MNEKRYHAFCMAVLILGISQTLTAQGPSQNQKPLSKQELQQFESKIRPILVKSCYPCHSAEANVAEGGLHLDSRQAILRGGSGGPAIVPGDPGASMLIRAVEYHDRDIAMPPETAGGKLSKQQISDLTKWVKMGAPDPREEKHSVDPTPNPTSESKKTWWAFQKIQSPPVPESKSDWAWNDIDKFIAKKQSLVGVVPVADASPNVLLRRIYYDLTGLPPSIQAQRKFDSRLSDNVPLRQVMSEVVDELLASEQFGVQWGRHWLDVARYAESAGREVNQPYNNAWRYRDYVVESFNSNVPFNEFLRKQIAGDQIAAPNEQEGARNLVATGFLAVGSRGLNENNAKQFAVDQADEQIDTVFQSTMAFTMACARCHDHKFDPVSQSEYTAIAGIFLSTETHFGAVGGNNNRNSIPLFTLPSSSGLPVAATALDAEDLRKKTEELASLKSELESAARDAKQDKKTAKDEGKAKDRKSQQELRKMGQRVVELENYLSAYTDSGEPKIQVMCAVDKPISDTSSNDEKTKLIRFVGGGRKPVFPRIDDSPFFARGDIDLPGPKVTRKVPDLFGNANEFQIPNKTSGRLQLANWITSDSNPMTARVAVNRIWFWMMGRGIVSSVDNFGTTGSLPSDAELLDHLASRFIEGKWNVKALVREIALSHTYQLASTVHDENNYKRDPENVFYWKGKSRRLIAEEIRDSILAATGQLDLKPQLATSMARQNTARLDQGQNKKRMKGEVNPDDVCRSIYLPLPRSNPPEILELFDLPDAAAVQGVREATNVPSQSLFLLNSSFVASRAGLMVKTVSKEIPARGMDKFDERLSAVYRRVLCREPSSNEKQLAREFLGSASSLEAGWISIVRSLFATAEFRYLD